MNNITSILLILALTAYAQQISVAVLPSDGDEAIFNNDDLETITNKMRSVALKTLPSETFTLLTQEIVVKRLGGAENFIKECKESSCIVDLGKKAQVDYVAQASVGKVREKMRIKVEVYDVSTNGLVGIYDGNGEYFDDYFVLLKAIDENVPDIFKKIPNAVPKAPVAKADTASVALKSEPVPVKEKGKRAWSVGIRAGLNSSYTYAVYDNVHNENGNYESGSGDYGDILGMQIGIVYDYALKDWLHLQPGLMYIQKGMNDSKSAEQFGDNGDWTGHYIELPLLLSLKLSAVRVNVGPYFDVCVECMSYDGDIDIGVNIGLGFDIGMFYIGMFYAHSISGNSNDSSEGWFDFYNRTLGFNLGINL